MSAKPIQVLVVDTDQESKRAIINMLEQIPGVEVTGIASSQRMAERHLESFKPDIIIIDFMLPGLRSIDLIRSICETHPEIGILALSPGDIPHDRVILSIRAGALGFITRENTLEEVSDALHQVSQGHRWLPIEGAYEVLNDAADELDLTAQERRGQLVQVLLGLIPLTGIVAAITSYLWRSYWGQIGVRVVDLGVDPSSRMVDVLVVLLMIVGIFGPLMFVKSWIESFGQWVEDNHSSLVELAAKARRHLLGRLVLNRWVAYGLIAIAMLAVLFWLTIFNPLIMVVFISPIVVVVLLANILDLDQDLPDALYLPQLGARQAIAFFAVVIIIFLMVIGTEVWLLEPDLRVDGLHGYLAPDALGFRARPVILHDLDGNFEPLGALYLGGNADLYVLYDPCAETVRLVPVGSSRVQLVDQVVCNSP